MPTRRIKQQILSQSNSHHTFIQLNFLKTNLFHQSLTCYVYFFGQLGAPTIQFSLLKFIPHIYFQMNPEQNVYGQQKMNLGAPPSLLPMPKFRPHKSEGLLGEVEETLKKLAYKRNKSDNAVITELIEDVSYLQAVSKCTSLQFVRHLMKNATLKKLKQGEVLCETGKKIENIYVIVEGGLGLVSSMHHSTNILCEQQLSVTLEQLMKKKPNQNDFIYIAPRPRLMRRNTIGMTDSLGMFGREKILDITELGFNKLLDRGEAYGDVCLAYGWVYTDIVVAMTKTVVLSFKPNHLFEGLLEYRQKKNAEDSHLFRSVCSGFNYLSKQKLSELISISPIKTLTKGYYVFHENEEAQNFYILLEGELKITKNAQLFLENPNTLYGDRKKIMGQSSSNKLKKQRRSSLTPVLIKKQVDHQECLPYANFSSIYNYQPKTKSIELGILADVCVFGEEEVFSNIPRQVSVQAVSTSAKFFVLSKQTIEKLLLETKNLGIKDPMPVFERELYQSITKTRILYRQEKLAQILQIENKNQMDYFYLGDEQEKKSMRKVNLVKINKAVSQQKTIKLVAERQPEEQTSRPMFHGFNFTKMLLEKNQREDEMSGLMNAYERKVAALTHTVSLISGKVRDREKRAKKMDQKVTPIDIQHPLFEQAYLRKKYVEPTMQDLARRRAKGYLQRATNTPR